MAFSLVDGGQFVSFCEREGITPQTLSLTHTTVYMGEVKKRPVAIEVDGEDQIAIRPMMYLALSYDHRIIDGVTGNSFLYRVARYIESAEFEV